MSKEAGKKLAAENAVNNYVENNMKLGIGSGSTVVYAVGRLAERVKAENLSVICVPTSFQARQLIIDNKLHLSDLEQTPELDLVIDGADEIDPNFNVIKGGGGCQVQEKIVASCAKKLIIIADFSKAGKHLGDKWTKGVPIEVLPSAWRPICNKITKKYGGTAQLRNAVSKAGPVITDNGNFIVDWVFPLNEGVQNCSVQFWGEVDLYLSSMPGVVGTGLFIKMASAVFIGEEDGTVRFQQSQ